MNSLQCDIPWPIGQFSASQRRCPTCFQTKSLAAIIFRRGITRLAAIFQPPTPPSVVVMVSHLDTVPSCQFHECTKLLASFRELGQNVDEPILVVARLQERNRE